MPDREEVIERLKRVSRYFKSMLKVGYDGDSEIYREHRKSVKMALALLKEQEATKPKTGHWIFESAYCEAWSHTCSECGKRMTTAYNTYANYCWNCGTKMEGQ